MDIKYLLTDQTVIGALAWIGFIITVIGLWIAITQILKAKDAAQAASLAVGRLEKAVQSRERLLELSAAAAVLGAAKDHVARKNFQSAIVLIDVAIPPVHPSARTA